MPPKPDAAFYFSATAGSSKGRGISSGREGLLRLLGAEDHRMDVAAWLQDLGLERCVPVFRENEIDERVLPSLTAEDLKDLGVTLVGHRRRLLDAIAALGSATARSPPPAAGEAERRQLTVMFCDLVGSMALSSRLDPEDLREVVGAYHRAVADAVRSFDGFVAKYMGDGVLVYFGYPQAHEDDAERAVRAGLGLIDAVSRLDVKSIELQARVGIATGLVVVGDLIGEGSAQEQSVVGETPNLADRLQALAEPDAVAPPALFLLALPPGQRAVPVHRPARPDGRVLTRRPARFPAGVARGRARPRGTAGRGCGVPRRSLVIAGFGDQDPALRVDYKNTFEPD
jgi:class 3 adenylate cyclase